MAISTARVSGNEAKAISGLSAGEQSQLFDIKQKLSLIDGRLRPLLLKRDKAKIALTVAKRDGDAAKADMLMRELSAYEKEAASLAAKRDALVSQSRRMVKAMGVA